MSKGQSQRKRRSDSCINNVKLSLNCTKDYATSTNHSRRSNPYYTSNCNPKTYANVAKLSKFSKRASLDNVSTDPWGKNVAEGRPSSSLRRSRSLAISREDLFASLDGHHLQAGGTRKRAQLIPRARLIDRTIRENNRFKGLSADNLLTRPDRYQSRRNSSQTLQEYSSNQEPLYGGRQHTSDPLYTYTSLQNIHENLTQPDSLDSNFNNKSSVENIYRVSYEDLNELSLPNYYPEAKYDTDNTDNISLTDNISSLSLDNLSKSKLEKVEYESISYDENIVLSTNKNLYEETKPRTIRNPTPFREDYGTVNPKIKAEPQKPIEESDSNLDEINLKIENISKTPEAETKSSPSPPPPPAHNLIKTLLEVPGCEFDPEQYKTIVAVDSPQTCTESKTHSHNYLKEFLESQKGSKRPLQNFIAKKLSNLSRRNSKAVSNLSDNQFHSLPDISISKNLRKCEKIDRKLRKCSKVQSDSPADASKESRFIVNIGNHFDLTSSKNSELDFEVKIAKVPKKGRNQNVKHSEEQFLEAVKKLKNSLNENRTNTEEEKGNMALMYCQEECNKEFQEKIGTMKKYWNKVMGKEEFEENDKCKIVDVTTKVDNVKKIFEPPEETSQETLNKVQMAKQIFEAKTQEKSGKISPNIKESCSYFENKKPTYYNNDKFQSLCPNSVEIIDANIATDTVDSKEKQHKPLTQSNSTNSQPDFDHIRYKLVKPDLFQKKIFANVDNECPFDDLIQYLQDYSFQELLVDNNIIIIEPIRSKVPYEPSPCVKSMKNASTALRNNQINNIDDNKSSLNRKFFYHPIRVNKEVNEDELPSPDTVRQVRQLFEPSRTKTTSFSKETDTTHIDPDKDRCSATDSNSNPSNISDFGSHENLYDSIDNEIYCEYVSEDILKKIRERGTTVTYYGGRVVDKNTGQSVLTKSIMDEIKFNERRCMECSNCKKEAEKDSYRGVKLKILKSNSCSSRLELVGPESKNGKQKFIANHKNVSRQNGFKNNDSINEEHEKEKTSNKNNEKSNYSEKNEINESIKKKMESNTYPKIIGEEMKVTQWKDVTNGSQKIYNFYEYDKIKDKSKKIEDMEFEPYEVA